MTKLENAFQELDWTRLKEVAHTFKTKAGYLGIAALESLLQELEDMEGMSHKKSVVNGMLKKVAHYVHKANEALSEIHPPAGYKRVS